MKHIFYHLTAIMVVAVWGMTFISTKVLIVHGLSPQEIFFFRFLLAYIVVCPISSHCPTIQQALPVRAEKGGWAELLLCHRKIFFW